MQPKIKGELVEQIILTEFMKRGVACSKPIGDNQPYDLIIDLYNKLWKVQCRSARITGKTKSAVEFHCTSCRSNMSKVYHVDYRDKFDLFAVCVLNNPFAVFIVDSKETKSAVFSATLPHSKRKTARKIKDYHIDVWLKNNAVV